MFKLRLTACRDAWRLACAGSKQPGGRRGCGADRRDCHRPRRRRTSCEVAALLGLLSPQSLHGGRGDGGDEAEVCCYWVSSEGGELGNWLRVKDRGGGGVSGVASMRGARRGGGCVQDTGVVGVHGGGSVTCALGGGTMRGCRRAPPTSVSFRDLGLGA